MWIIGLSQNSTAFKYFEKLYNANCIVTNLNVQVYILIYPYYWLEHLFKFW